jgi:selenocysteine lyase/cysteine desulfurase
VIYLDSAATSLIKPASVERAVLHALRSMASPGRGGHAPAMLAADAVYACREAAAALFHVPEPSRVVFTMNATHALNIAIRSLLRPGARAVISGFEHNAVTRPLRALGADVRIAGCRLFDPADTLLAWRRALPGAEAAVCTMVSNVFGYVLPIDAIAELCRAEGVRLIVDASQAAGVLPVDFEALGAAFIAMPGHKGLLGPQGTGLLLCGEEGVPLLQGGSGSESRLQTMPEALPERLEAGTHNVCGIAGLLEGIRFVSEKGTEAILAHETALLRTAADCLDGSGLELFTGPEAAQSGVLSLRCPWTDCEELAARLAERGVCVRAGLHCAPTAHESAGTLETGTLRLSFSPFTGEGELARACSVLLEESEKTKRN